MHWKKWRKGLLGALVGGLLGLAMGKGLGALGGG